VLDFSMHYLSHCKREIVIPKHIKQMRFIFLLGFCISASGYGLFLLSPMQFLHQIAIISIFTLLGAFLSSYFLLPYLLEYSRFKQTRIFRYCFLRIILAIKYVKKLHIILPILILCGISGVILFISSNTQDNLKTYTTLPKHLLLESKQFFEKNPNITQSEIVLLDSNDLSKEKELIFALKDKNLIEDYEGLSKFFLHPTEQQNLITLAKNLSNDMDFLANVETMGIDKNDVKNALQDIANSDIIDINDVLKDTKNAFNQQFSRFTLQENNAKKHIIFLKNATKNEAFFEALNANNAILLNVVDTLNENFSAIKMNALYLKLFGFCVALIMLCVCFGLLKGSVMIGLVLLANGLSLAIFWIFGIEYNIFVIFGLILAGAVGIDYMIFAINKHLSRLWRAFGIIMASLTSVISFILLSFSQTNAIASFGIATSLTMIFCALFAMCLAIGNINRPKIAR